MVQVLIFVGGVLVGYGFCKLSDVFKGKQNSNEFTTQTFQSHRRSLNENATSQNQNSMRFDLVDISSLAPMMSLYGIEPSAGNCIYLLCSKIKSNTFKKLLDDIVENTSNGEEFIAFLDKANIDSFIYPNVSDNTGRFYVTKSSIDQLINESGIRNCQLDAYGKIETLINMAYASAIERLKKNFGSEISRILKAAEEQKDLTSYYNDLIKEVQVSREFLNS